MNSDELKSAGTAERPRLIDLPSFRQGDPHLAPWKDKWRVIVWLENDRVFARDDYTAGKPVEVESGDGLGASLSQQAKEPRTGDDAATYSDPTGRL